MCHNLAAPTIKPGVPAFTVCNTARTQSSVSYIIIPPHKAPTMPRPSPAITLAMPRSAILAVPASVNNTLSGFKSDHAGGTRVGVSTQHTHTALGGSGLN